jgi:hypothetical protein
VLFDNSILGAEEHVLSAARFGPGIESRLSL